MQVRLLGPVDVVTDGVSRSIPGLRRKAVLTVLALHAGEIVSTDRLIDIVWGERPPATELNTLQSHVSTLRRALGARSTIVSRPPGYVLELPADATDVAVAERLIRAGRQASDPARGAELLLSALALWRGRPLADVAEVPWLAEQSDRLEKVRLEARRALVNARLLLGEHTQLLPELRCLAARHPFDEQVHRQLILALYRAGRQADALAALSDVRELLAKELGIDPGPALRELQTAILRQDDALAPPQQPRSLIGRERELHRALGPRRRANRSRGRSHHPPR